MKETIEWLQYVIDVNCGCEETRGAVRKAIAIIEEASALVDCVSKDTLRDDVFRTMNYNSEMSLKRLIALINGEEASSNE